ncbi:peptidoglycan DD-metalloendopeptidase family protein [Streptomyces sp.]|uniref:peptidoglycan DD-metalloendopeptidase family protein n=1 Tax=Streptomyces sp. TaxID=1931 RepID=UPI00281236A5|nr:peptidoglycan DD-metalloendopeptidase family protein [Streptomyces sp.]
MNDQHPYAGYVEGDAHSTGSFAIDPLFGAYPGGQADHSGSWDLGQYDTGTPAHAASDDTGAYETYGDATGQWDSTGQWSTATTTAYPGTAPYDAATTYDTTGQWDASAWTDAQATGAYETVHSGTYTPQGTYGYEAYDATGQWAAPVFTTDTGAYDATAWNQAPAEAEPVVPHQYTPEPLYDADPENGDTDTGTHSTGDAPAADHTAEFAFVPEPAPAADDGDSAGDGDVPEYAYEGDTDHDPDAVHRPAVEVRTDEPAAAGRSARRTSGGGRGRRRTPAKRSALLTVAVPSACVMGVAGIAAASVSGLTAPQNTAAKKDDTTTLAAADPAAVQQNAANKRFETQLVALDNGARDFGDRASRTQERIDLRVRQEAERKKRAEEAALREAMRPKFMLPVKLHQLSARYGQSGVNWMSVHTGIDFPVQYGTKVMAATDGTVRTQWNSAYGNMAIVTAKDGTETWYCHLSSTKIRSGEVKAGDVIAYSGNSGNSTGPHLHFEVRPGGGSAIDPLAWLRSHGLDPTS